MTYQVTEIPIGLPAMAWAGLHEYRAEEKREQPLPKWVKARLTYCYN